MSNKRPKLLILGLDGMGLDLVEQFVCEGLMPHLGGLLETGLRSPLQSTNPPVTLPAWTSFFTGVGPSSHGIPDFTVRQGYGVRFVSAASRRFPTLFAYLENCGLKTGAAWFPGTYPPEKLSGFCISGWDSPVTVRGDHSFVFPKGLHGEMLARFGTDHLSFDSIDEFSDGEEWLLEAAESLSKRVLRRSEMACWLLDRTPLDVAAFYFGEADTAAHHFWAHHDPESPRRPPTVVPQLAQVVRNVYQALDAAVGRILSKVGEETPVVVLSDHGSGGSSNVGVHLNRVLADAGLLRFNRPSSRGNRLNAAFLRGRVPSMVPPKLRRWLFRLGGGAAPSAIESKIRFGGIDFSATKAFSEEVNYAPSVWLNQLGREPSGQVPYRERDKVADKVEDALLSLLGPDDLPLVRRVLRREAVHRGPLIHLFPDLIIEYRRRGQGYTPASLPSNGTIGPSVSVIKGSELLGRKGRSLPGCHTRFGILLVRGPMVSERMLVKARLEDVAPLITDMMGLPRAWWFEGDSPCTTSSKPAALGHFGGEKKVSSTYNGSREAVVAERLKRLGYLEF